MHSLTGADSRLRHEVIMHAQWNAIHKNKHTYDQVGRRSVGVNVIARSMALFVGLVYLFYLCAVFMDLQTYGLKCHHG